MQRVVSPSIDRFNARDWDALSHDGSPFLRHAFLGGLEHTGCVGGRTGWDPTYLALEDSRGLTAAVPLYSKVHSYGEFVFDFAWAQAYARSGRVYYPKLVAAVPFTPATGTRLLVRGDLDRTGTSARLIEELEAHVRRHDFSSVHALFPDAQDLLQFETAGWLVRRDCQFHWRNRGYASFEDYLATFTAEKRKKARRERRRVAEAGVCFETWGAADLDVRRLDAVYALHRDTFLRHGHEPYLTREFFTYAARTPGDALMVKAALWHGDLVACAIFFESPTTLYGRYWGATDAYHSLHFETCYHQGIDYCIAKGLARFEPGTQGEHKVARGFEPAITHSAHFIADPRMRAAIGEYVAREGEAVDAYAANVREHVPFRQGERGEPA